MPSSSFLSYFSCSLCPVPTCFTVVRIQGKTAESCPDLLTHRGTRCLGLCLCVSGFYPNRETYCGVRFHVEVKHLHKGWHTFVSRCLPQVLSHNLYTVLNIPHDPVALEEHFQDDDDGPVSNHGYMPYLNKYILDKVLWEFRITPSVNDCTRKTDITLTFSCKEIPWKWTGSSVTVLVLTS